VCPLNYKSPPSFLQGVLGTEKLKRKGPEGRALTAPAASSDHFLPPQARPRPSLYSPLTLQVGGGIRPALSALLSKNPQAEARRWDLR